MWHVHGTLEQQITTVSAQLNMVGLNSLSFWIPHLFLNHWESNVTLAYFCGTWVYTISLCLRCSITCHLANAFIQSDLQLGAIWLRSCRLAVGGLPVRSHPGRVEVSLSKTPNPQLLMTSWLVPCMAANRRWCVNVCVNGWMRGINCTALWIKALYKCSPFTIYSWFV